MQTVVVTARVTSKLERLMRKRNRRIIKYSSNWSEEGAAIITRLIIKQICSPKEWENDLIQSMK
jgi:hypothetical protein